VQENPTRENTCFPVGWTGPLSVDDGYCMINHTAGGNRPCTVNRNLAAILIGWRILSRLARCLLIPAVVVAVIGGQPNQPKGGDVIRKNC
jgi:hypothetical protein